MGFFRLVPPKHQRRTLSVLWIGIQKLLLGFWLGVLCLITALPAVAAEGIEFVDATLSATDEGYSLSSNFSVELTHAL